MPKKCLISSSGMPNIHIFFNSCVQQSTDYHQFFMLYAIMPLFSCSFWENFTKLRENVKEMIGQNEIVTNTHHLSLSLFLFLGLKTKQMNKRAKLSYPTTSIFLYEIVPSILNDYSKSCVFQEICILEIFQVLGINLIFVSKLPKLSYLMHNSLSIHFISQIMCELVFLG